MLYKYYNLLLLTLFCLITLIFLSWKYSIILILIWYFSYSILRKNVKDTIFLIVCFIGFIMYETLLTESSDKILEYNSIVFFSLLVIIVSLPINYIFPSLRTHESKKND